MKDRLFEALKKSSADYAEIRVETLETTQLAYRGREMETAEASAFQGGIVRACTKGGWGSSRSILWTRLNAVSSRPASAPPW